MGKTQKTVSTVSLFCPCPSIQQELGVIGTGSCRNGVVTVSPLKARQIAGRMNRRSIRRRR
jgi:hypothetical protein